MYAALLHCSEGLELYKNKRSQSGSGAKGEYNNQIGADIVSTSIFFSKYLQSREIPSIKWAERDFCFSDVFLSIYAYAKKQIPLELAVFSL